MATPVTVANCFVGMFDIIGFKALRASLGTAGLHQRYVRGIAPMIAHAAAGSGKIAEVDGVTMYVPNPTPLSSGFRAISDTVIFFTPDDSFSSFLSIVHSSFFLLQSGFSGGKAPYRGAIGWGDLVNDPSGILIGSAIEDAYAGESSQAWAGCMLTEQRRSFANSNTYVRQFREFHLQVSAQVKEEVARRNAIENSERLVEYPVPLQQNPKDGPTVYFTQQSYVIDWTIRMYEGAAKKSFNPSESQHAQNIAKNTVEFERWARQRQGDL